MSRDINRKLKHSTARELIFYSMLPFGMLTISTTMGTALNMYLTDVLGLSIVMFNIIMLSSRVWDAINDPVMGFIVDRTKTKWGKCRPYILWATPGLVLVTAFLFFPVGFKGNGNFVYVLILYWLFYAANTSLDIPYQGMTPLLFPDNKARVKAVSVGNIVGSLGTILPSMLFFTIAGLWGRERQKEGYFYTALVFSVLAGIFIIASFFGIKEKVYLPPKQTNLKQVMKLLFTDKKIIILTVSFVFNAAINMGAFFLPYFCKWNCIGVLPMEQWSAWIGQKFNIAINLTSEGILTPVIQIGSGISYMLSMALIPLFLKRMDKKKLLIWTSLLGAVASVTTFAVGIWLVPYNTVQGLILYTGLRFFTNFPVGISTVLFIAMFSDVTDDLEMRYGERLEGSVFSIKSLVMKITMAGFNALMMFSIRAFGYDIGKMNAASNNVTVKLVISTTQPNIIGGVNYTSLMNAIFFMITALGALGLVLQAIPLFFYDFDEKAQEEKLEAYRGEKERRMQQELEREAALQSG